MNEANGGPPKTRVPLSAWWTASLLLILYMVSTVDRGIVPMLVTPIQTDLHLTDFQMSLILGPAFSICYAALGIPLGWAADRYPRRWVIFAGVSMWSIALSLSGLATSFISLLVTRLGVATGEASLSPAAYSLIGDKFPRDRLTTGLGVYGMGPKLGLSASYGVGTLVILLASHMGATHIPGVGDLQPWQLTLVMMGLPGMLIALLVFTISEPARTTHKRNGAGDERLLAYMRRDWRPLLPLFLGFTLANICGQALQQWVPTYITRRFDMGAAEYGPIMSAISFVAAMVVVLKGMVVDWLFKRGVTDIHVRFYTWLLLLALLPMTAAFLVDKPWQFFACIAIVYAATLSFMVYAVAALQILGPPELRGQLAAVLLLCVSGISPSVGGMLVGAITDFWFHDSRQIGHSMAIVCVGAMVASLITLSLALRPIRRAVADETR